MKPLERLDEWEAGGHGEAIDLGIRKPGPEDPLQLSYTSRAGLDWNRRHLWPQRLNLLYKRAKHW